MKPTMWKNYWATLLCSLFALVLVSCGSGDEAGSESMISGESNKTWTTSKEVNAAGGKEKLSEEEKAQSLQFYADGRFAMGGGSALETGTWSFDPAAKRLSLQFADQNVIENFDVLKLTDDEMRLKAEDGFEMLLEAE
ncbi:hypothetical protein I2I11_00700 [Pontibacter sp. 172403-2]|uniref:hypothetical protein n=1 Tax=Pontibacter rufus TaxID=2791028 RepID=UPI0018B0166E|nr:hypothetical protein [Pontibacter sp. 172403-2]MBF9251802.1 hypothetical protein [Pontibacter sp. 172403-2]